MTINKTNTIKPEISIDEVYTKFDRHIRLEENKRIIFSGAYGIGKTFFLKKYFERTDEFNPIFISPVNYSVCKNEDVFELIKADIIFQLFNKNLIEFDENFEFENVSEFGWYLFKYSEPFKIASSLIPLIIKTDLVSEESGEQIKIAYKIYETLKTQYSKFKKKFEDDLNKENKELENFIEKLLDEKGGLYERDFVTQFINEILLNVSKTKANVLVIDDLDRLDPDHIFRILNILSAHNNHLGTENKFGFEKIILVSDLNNIEKIYQYKYGPEVDFDGYIDKFYSIEKFHFSNDDAIDLYLSNNLSVHLDKQQLTLLEIILKASLKCGLLTLRQLFKYKYFENLKIGKTPLLKAKYTSRHCNKNWFIEFQVEYLTLYSTNINVLKVPKILTAIWGDIGTVRKNLENIKVCRDFNISKKKSISVSEALILFERLITCEEDTLFYGKTEYSHDIQFPSGSIFGNEYYIELPWEKRNQFTEDKEYFETFEIKLTLNKKVTLSALCEKLIEVCNFAEEKGILDKISKVENNGMEVESEVDKHNILEVANN